MLARNPSTAGRSGRAAHVLSTVLLMTSAAASVTALAMPQLIHGEDVMIGSMRGTALVVVLVAIPVLTVSMAVGEGRLLGVVGWMAGVVFLAYQAWMFLFAVPFNGLFLVYVAMLASGFWALVAMLAGLDAERLAGEAAHRIPVRVLAGWMVGSCVAFYALWLRNVVPALFDSESPAFLAGTGMVTATNYVLDLAFFLPFTIVAAVALWRRTAWGVVVGGAMLVVLVLESVSIAVDQWVGAAADPSSTVASAALTPAFAVIGLIGAGMTWLWYRGTTTSDPITPMARTPTPTSTVERR